MATQQIDEYYESLAYWKQQAQDYEQALRDIEYNTIMNMTAEILFSVQLDMLEKNKQMGDEITALKSKLKIAKRALEYVAAEGYRSHTRSLSERQQDQMIARNALNEIGGEI